MIPLEPILERYGVDYSHKERNQQLCCPIHDETHPSFSVNLDKGLFQCFACGARGDAITFVMLKEGLDFAPAKRIAEEAARGFDGQVPRESDGGRSLLPRKSGHRPGRRNWVSPWSRN